MAFKKPTYIGIEYRAVLTVKTSIGYEQNEVLNKCSLYRNCISSRWNTVSRKRKRKVFFQARSVYAAKDIKAGEVFTKENIRVVRPGDGLEPKYYEQLLGRRAKQDLKAGTALRWECV